MTALLSSALWSTSTTTLIWRASYLSQTSSTLLWLVSLWGLLRWTESRRPVWLAVVAAGLSWLYLTRPLTGLALALPCAVVILRNRPAGRLIRELAPAAAVLAAVLALQFVWQDQTMDNWTVSPYAEYSRQYFPFVKPGFGLDPTPPARSGPPEITWVARQFEPLHESHQIAHLPAILLARLVGLFSALGQGWRGFLIVMFVVSVVRATGALRFAAWSAAGLLAAYLVYAHPAGWVVYYAEIFPVFFLLAAAEIRRVLRLVLKLDEERSAAILAACLLLALLAGLHDVRTARDARDQHGRFHRRAAAVLERVPAPTVVFVRYPPGHPHHQSLIANSPDYRAAPLWIVYDRDADNHRLLETTDRAAYRLDVASWTLERIR